MFCWKKFYIELGMVFSICFFVFMFYFRIFNVNLLCGVYLVLIRYKYVYLVYGIFILLSDSIIL